MALYRKKPVVIEAVQWDGTVSRTTAVIDWMLAHGGTARYHGEGTFAALRIDTLEGTMTAVPGDWVIKGVKGVYPCKPDIFAATYELVADASDEDRIRDAMAEAQDHPGRTVTR
jgi:hypothetical protein